jgi:hypothetical protein
VLFVDQNWHQKLLNRNPEIRYVITCSLDQLRALAVLKTETFIEYFALYDLIRQEYRIIAQDTYNIDEKGFAIGIMQQSHIFMPTSEKEAFL